MFTLCHVVPTPNVSILASDGVLLQYAQAGTSLKLTCSVSVDPAIAGNVTVSVTWLQGENPLFNTTDRVSITYSDSDSQSPFTSILTLYPVNTTDSGNFTCRAGVVTDTQLQLFTDSDLAEDTIQVIVVGKQLPSQLAIAP